MLAAEKKLLKRRKIALCLGQVSRLQILPGLFKALFKLLLVRMLSGGGTNPTDFDPAQAADVYDARMQEYVRAEQLGFDSVWFTTEFYHAARIRPIVERLSRLSALIFSPAAVLKAGN